MSTSYYGRLDGKKPKKTLAQFLAEESIEKMIEKKTSVEVQKAMAIIRAEISQKMNSLKEPIRLLKTKVANIENELKKVENCKD